MLDLLKKKPQHESRKNSAKKESIDLYSIRILIQLALRSNPSEFQGSYSDSDFASLLVSSVFSDSYFLRYGAFIILEAWVSSSSSHKELFSSITIPSSFFTILSQCPTREVNDEDWEFRARLRPVFIPLNRTLSVILVLCIGFGMRMNDSSEETLAKSLTALSSDIDNAEQSFQDETSIPKELKTAKTKTEQLLRLINKGNRKIEIELDDPFSTLDEDGNTILHLLAQREEEEDTLIDIEEMMKDSNDKYRRLIEQPNRDGRTP